MNAIITRSMTFENDCIPIRIQNLSLKKLFNAVRVGLSITVKSNKKWGRPTTLQVEPSSLCNLQCDLCPVAEGMGRKTGNMDLELFKKIIDEVGDYVLLIILWDWGEPFVNPAIYDMIAYAKKYNINVISSTNAHAFAKQENAKKLIKSGIDSIIVAIDGIHQGTYERFRKTGKLDTALQGVHNLVAAKRDLKSPTPLINFRFIATRHNEKEIPELKKLAKSLGVDVLTIKTLNPYEFYSENVSKRQTYYEEVLPQDPRYQRFNYKGPLGNRQRIKRNPKCTRAWDCLTIHWDGIVGHCTYDYKDKYIYGNVKSDTIDNVWFRSSMPSIRKWYKGGWKNIDLCRNCTNTFEGGACDGETIVQVFYSRAVADLFSKPENPEKVQPL
jgi:radical SAM protein with 4Fe4S-binding SPASM domain